jgi:hypothetical protein
MAIRNDGHKGEEELHRWLKKSRFTLRFQPDGLAKINGQWHLFEAKYQERFEAPPFDGHGLPPWQVKARLRFQKDTGIIAWLWILDKETDEIFYQRLDILESSEDKITTEGKHKRRVYSIRCFHKIPPAI